MHDRPWWQDTATNFWRTYFKILDSGSPPASKPDQLKFDTCAAVFSSLSPRDQQILRTFHSAPFGFSAYAAEDFSARTGTAIPVIYSVINKAARAAMTELGIVNPVDTEKR